MPGPSNNKGKGKFRGRHQRRSTSGKSSNSNSKAQKVQVASRELSSEQSLSSTPSIKTPPPLLPHELPEPVKDCHLDERIPKMVEDVLFQEPFIHDPGNGPRVRDPRAFMSSFFAQPAAVEDPVCAEFAQGEVLEMLQTILPEEMSLILWYNKSRSHSRVCPACQRLYRIGDALPDLLDDTALRDKPVPDQQLREQTISGICSPVCFVLASFNFPSAIKAAWGATADEMDEETWDLLNDSDPNAPVSEESRSLGMLVKMTRLHDLGLAQLCFGPEEASLLEAAAAAA